MSKEDFAWGSGNWTNDSNWNLGGPPTASEDAFIGDSFAESLFSEGNVTVNSIGLSSGSTLAIDSGVFNAANGTDLSASDQGVTASGIAGFVYVDAGAAFAFGNTLDNSGQIFIGSSGVVVGEMLLNGSPDIIGDGTINLGGATGGAGNRVFYSGDIIGVALSNYGNTIDGGGVIDVASVYNGAGVIDANQQQGFALDITATTFTNDALMEIGEQATMELGGDGATGSLANSGTLKIGYYEGFVNSGAEATLAISGDYTINGSGSIDFGGDDASIIGDGAPGDLFTNGPQSSIHADFTGEIGNGSSVVAPNNLTFDNDGDVFATGAGVRLTINTGANTVNDLGGLMEADDNATLILDSAVQVGQYFLIGSPAPAGGTIEATSGGVVDVDGAVTNIPPPKFGVVRPEFGEVVADAGSTVVVGAGGSVATAIQINGASDGLGGGLVSLQSGGAITGAVTFDGAGGTFEDSSSAAATFSFSGGGGAIQFASSGNTADIGNTGGVLDSVTGSAETVDVTSADLSVIGGGDAISATSGSLVSVSGTGTDADAFVGSSAVFILHSARATLNGSRDSVDFFGSSALILNGESNVFHFGADLGVSSISGFNTSDTLDLSSADWASFSALQASGDLRQSGANAIIEINAADSLTLLDTQLSSLSASDVKFG